MDSVEKVLEKSGFGELNPVQKEALDAGLIGTENMVIAAPTASGKTLIAEIAILETVKKNKKAVYIVPLKALASEKYAEFKERYEPLGLRVGLSIGDMDSSDPWLARMDIIIITSEKLDSLLRHGIDWASRIGLVVVDEIHLLDSPDRGPTLEVVLTRLREISSPRVLGLSATISNYGEMADWLDARPVKSDYRPVKLLTGVCFENKVSFSPKGLLKLNPDEENIGELVVDSVKKGKQALVFVSTRRNAESVAEKMGKLVHPKLTSKEKKELLELSGGILGAVGHPTAQCRRLSGMVRDGVAFHHAGLAPKQRSLIEDAYRDGLVKIIGATPTLAWGVNLPAWRVIIRDTRRFSSGFGSDWLPTLDVQQMAGRAGRPKYDSDGQAIIMARSRRDAEYAWENYVKGEPERIFSKLGVEPVLRMHALSLISSGVTPDMSSLKSFFGRTFYAHQYGDMESLNAMLLKVVAILDEFGFVETDKPSEGPFRTGADMMKATMIGKRVSELYIDPITANHFIRNLEIAEKGRGGDLGYLHLMSNTMEMYPPLGIRKGDEERINEILVKDEKEMIERPPNPWDIEYEDYMRSVKTAMMFREWMNESGEDQMLEGFGVTPGELHTRLNNADWLLYSMQELALLTGCRSILKDIRRVRLRVKHGVREELLPLIKLRGIGRVRARKLFSSNLKTLDSLRKVPEETLSRILGPKTAREVKEQLS
jgi:helicase